ncbi:MAG: 3-isopropylmalate dehydratase small subunit [Rhodospirillales bacterium]|nr:3-isopropylmalate dehydratase small subunit [Rhodospirillales bacterium]
MQPFTKLSAVAAPLMRANIDTDLIIPMGRYLMAERADMHRFAFEVLRYLPDGSENPQFVLNKPAFRDAQILISGANFGCGSSRESAVWALHGLGIRCIITPGFGNIFYNNCFQSGLLPIVLDEATVEHLAKLAASGNGGPFEIDLEQQKITAPDGQSHAFAVQPQRRTQLLQGLDDIGVTLRKSADIKNHRAADEKARPWIYI